MRFSGIDFRPGYTVYRNGPGPVWVSPHSGPAIEIPTSRDDWSETIASLCWLKMGGTLIISNVSRKQMYGMDFNRERPDMRSSLRIFPEFVTDEHREKLKSYRGEYSWTSIDAADHMSRSRIYDDFWNTVKRSGNMIVFFHTQFTRIKNFPSVMELITYEGRGVDKKVIETITEKINEKYGKFFRHISKDYKEAIYLEHRRINDRINNTFGDFSLRSLKVEYRKNIMDDIREMKEHADRKVLRRLEKDFSEKNFMAALRSSLKTKTLPRITVERTFRGQKALKTKGPMFRKGNLAMEVETTNFLGYWYPKKARDIVLDILDDLVSVDMYKKLGAKQKYIAEYLKHN